MSTNVKQDLGVGWNSLATLHVLLVTLVIAPVVLRLDHPDDFALLPRFHYTPLVLLDRARNQHQERANALRIFVEAVTAKQNTPIRTTTKAAGDIGTPPNSDQILCQASQGLSLMPRVLGIGHWCRITACAPPLKPPMLLPLTAPPPLIKSLVKVTRVFLSSSCSPMFNRGMPMRKCERTCKSQIHNNRSMEIDGFTSLHSILTSSAFGTIHFITHTHTHTHARARAQ